MRTKNHQGLTSQRRAAKKTHAIEKENTGKKKKKKKAKKNREGKNQLVGQSSITKARSKSRREGIVQEQNVGKELQFPCLTNRNKGERKKSAHHQKEAVGAGKGRWVRKKKGLKKAEGIEKKRRFKTKRIARSPRHRGGGD